MNLDNITITVGSITYKRTIEGGLWYNDLSFSSGLNKVGTGSVTLYSKTKPDEIKVGATLAFKDKSDIFYLGYITDISDTNNWCYYSEGNEHVIININFCDVIKLLDYKQTDAEQKQYDGTPQRLARLLLGDYAGDIPSSDSATTFVINGASILSQLTKLANQTGWRYRTKPISETEFKIDFAPSFYQTESQGKLAINLSAMNTVENNSVDNQYGAVCATSSTPTGVECNCYIPLITKHNKDYSIDMTTYISTSWDGECISWNYNSSNSDSYMDSSGNRVYWEDDGKKDYNYKHLSCVIDCDVDPEYVKNYTYFVYYCGESTEPKHILLKDLSKFKTGPIKSGGEYLPGRWGIMFEPPSDIQKSLEGDDSKGDFDILGIKGAGYILADDSSVPHDGFAYLGSELVEYTKEGAATGAIVLTNFSYSKFHKRGVTFTYTKEVQPDSPYDKYGDRVICSSLQPGLGYANTDYMASILSIYGSNFDIQGSCDVPLFMFKGDNGWYNVGDHIQLYNSKTKETKDYELLAYNITINNLTVNVSFGTYVKGLPEIVNKIKMNMSTSIRQ